MATKKSEAEKKPIVKEDVKSEEQELVNVMIPYVEGQDPEVTVGINGVYTKVKKGRMVKVPKNVAEVLAQSDQMTMVALENQEKFKSQREDW